MEVVWLSGRVQERVWTPLQQIKKSYLDGAAFITRDGRAIVGLTPRYDRIDNFWFALLHEIGHLTKHLSEGSFTADDMSLRGTPMEMMK